MAQAIWNDKILAESDQTVLLEGNHYFPPDSIHADHFQKSTQTTHCPWKGTANYYDVVVDGQTNPGAAWFYADPKPEAQQIKGYVAFWKGVQVVAS